MINNLAKQGCLGCCWWDLRFMHNTLRSLSIWVVADDTDRSNPDWQRLLSFVHQLPVSSATTQSVKTYTLNLISNIVDYLWMSQALYFMPHNSYMFVILADWVDWRKCWVFTCQCHRQQPRLTNSFCILCICYQFFRVLCMNCQCHHHQARLTSLSELFWDTTKSWCTNLIGVSLSGLLRMTLTVHAQNSEACVSLARVFSRATRQTDQDTWDACINCRSQDVCIHCQIQHLSISSARTQS